MSAGFFDYKQSCIDNILDELECLELEEYSESIQLKIKSSMETLKKAYVYVNNLDWYLSGDTNEEEFLKELEDDLNDLGKP